MSKTCTSCKQTKKKSEFTRDRKEADGRKSRCHDCVSYQAYHFAAIPDEPKAYTEYVKKLLKVKKRTCLNIQN